MMTKTDAADTATDTAHSPSPYTDEEKQAFLKTIDDQGYVILPDCIDPGVLARVNARVDEIAAQKGGWPGASKEETKSLIIMNLMGKGSAFWELITQPGLLDFVTTFLGEDCLLSSASVRGLYPGADVQGLHTDDALYANREDWFERPLKRQLSLVATVALSDFTETNGATLLFPGSHRWTDEPWDLGYAIDAARPTAHNQVALDVAKKKYHAERIKLVMSAGSVAVWSGGVWHQGGAYTAASGEERRAILFNFCRGIFRQQENQLALIRPEEAAEMPPAVQRLLGYTMSATRLGYAEGADPATLLGRGGEALAKMNKELAERSQL